MFLEGLASLMNDMSPAYYEDSDLCMGIHRLGYKVVFDPGVMVFHHEFTSIGSFENARLLMESNRKRFVKKWGHQLKREDRSVSK